MNSNSYPALIGAAFAVLATFAVLIGAAFAALTTFAAAGARKCCKNLLGAMQESRKQEGIRVVGDLPTSASQSMVAVKAACNALLTTARQYGGRQLTNALRRSWSAYKAWRVEQAAINELSSLSDRELKDIGLHRCAIVRAVRDRARSERTFFFRTENQSVAADRRVDAVVGVVAVPIYRSYSNPEIPIRDKSLRVDRTICGMEPAHWGGDGEARYRAQLSRRESHSHK